MFIIFIAGKQWAVGAGGQPGARKGHGPVSPALQAHRGDGQKEEGSGQGRNRLELLKI